MEGTPVEEEAAEPGVDTRCAAELGKAAAADAAEVVDAIEVGRMPVAAGGRGAAAASCRLGGRGGGVGCAGGTTPLCLVDVDVAAAIPSSPSARRRTTPDMDESWGSSSRRLEELERGGCRLADRRKRD